MPHIVHTDTAHSAHRHGWRRSLSLVAATSLLLVAGLPTLGASGVEPSDTISRLAGTGAKAFSGDGGPAVAAKVNLPRDTAMGPDGSIYLTDTYNQRVRRIWPDGTITTVAGTGATAYNGDNILATKATLYWPHDVTVADDGTVYVADSAHHRVRRIDPVTGLITTVFGTGASGSSGNGGPGTKARLKNPKSVALFDGGLFVADLSHRVRRLDLSTGIVTQVAGTGTAGYSGDGGSALSARLDSPQRLAIDSVGNIYVADSGNDAVRRIDAASGIITTVAGRGVAGFSGDGGLGTNALLRSPRGIALAGDSTLYIADSDNHRIRKLDLETGIITTLAGSSRGFSGDGGPASAARFYNPRGLTVDPAGRLIIADTFNSVLRVITPPPPGP